MNQTTTRRAALIAAGAAAALPALALRAGAQTTVTTAAAPAGTAMPADAMGYAEETLKVGTFLKMTSEIAREKAQGPKVQEFAALEIEEEEAVTAVLTGLGATAPDTLEGDLAAMVQTLRDAEAGAAFDAAYLDAQIMGHEMALPVQEQMAQMEEISVPVATAKLLVPAIQSHLAMLRTIQEMSA